MEKYKKYYGVMIFSAAVILTALLTFVLIIKPVYERYESLSTKEEQTAETLEQKKTSMATIQKKIARLRESVMSSQKKIYYPVETNLGNDTLFFTLYSDLLEMVHSNSIKIDSIEYKYNPDGDPFVKQGANYFVCDVDLKLVSNYVNLGKLIQDIYQYPYYVKINNIDIYPYPKDKKILLTSMSVRLYAHTEPEPTEEDAAPIIDGAATGIPQE